MHNNWRRVLSLVLVLALISGNIFSLGNLVFAEEELGKDQILEGEFIFDEEDQRITGYKGQVPRKLVIPSEINGIKVKNLGAEDKLDQDFIEKGIEELILPDGLETIEQRVFLRNQIKNLDLPQSLRIIRGGAFKGNDIEAIDLPEEIEEIRAAAFEDNKIKSLEIPSKLEKIGDDAFKNNKLEEIIIPSNILEIGSGAFASNPIENVDLGEVEVIGGAAFHSTELREVKLPESLKEIGISAFGNTKIEECRIPKSVEKIGRDAFYSKGIDVYTRIYLEDEENEHRLSSGVGTVLNPVELEVINKASDGSEIEKEIIVGQKSDGSYIYDYDRNNKESDFFTKDLEIGIKAKKIDGFISPRSKSIKLKNNNSIEFFYDAGEELDETKLEVLLVNHNLKEFEKVGGVYKLTLKGKNPVVLDLLSEMKKTSGVDFKTENGSYGEYITQIGDLKQSRANSIMYNINDEKASLGASSQDLHEGDKVLFFMGNSLNGHKGPKWSEFIEGEKNQLDLKGLIDESLKWSLINNDNFNFSEATSLMVAGKGLQEISGKLESHMAYLGYKAKPLNTIRNYILGNNMEYLEDVKAYDFNQKANNINTIEPHIYSMIALNMLGEDYNRQLASDNLVEHILSGDIKDNNMGDAIAAIVDSGAKVNKKQLLDNVNKRLSNPPTNIEYYAPLLEALVNLGEEVDNSSIEKFLEFKKDDGYATTLLMTTKKDGQELKALKLFLTVNNKENIFRTAAKKVNENPAGKNEYKLEIDKSQTSFKEFDEIKLPVKTYLNGEELELDYKIVSDNTDVLLVRNEKDIVIKNSGQASLKFVLKEDKTIFDEVKILVEKVEAKSGQGNINDFIDAISIYYNREHFKENGGKLTAFEYGTFQKLGLSTARWEVEEDYKPSYDEGLKYVGNKARQVEVMLASGRDPRNYKGRDLIGEIVEVLNTGKSDGRDFDFAAYPYLLGAVAVNNYKEAYPNDKVNYNEDKVLNMIRAAQEENGGLIERSIENGIAPRNTALALELVAKINGGEDIKEKILSYFQLIQKENGGFFEKAYITNYNADIVKALAIAGEDLTSSKWTRGENNPIESLFYLYRSNNSFKDFVGEDMSTLNNPHERDLDCKVATQAVLEALGEVRKTNADYIVKSAKISEAKEISEREIEVNTAIIVLDREGKFEIKNAPTKLKLNNKKQTAGLTALGSLQGTTSNIKINYGFVEEIEGIKNSGTGGWMYSINDKLPNLAAGYTDLKENDKVLWFYLPEELLKDKNLVEVMPKWQDLSGEKNSEILEEIAKNIPKNLKQKMDSDIDKNILEVLDKIIKDKGYENIELRLLSVEKNDEFTSIDEKTGDINYFYKHPSEVKGLYNQQRPCKIELKLGKDTKEIEVRPNILWDKEKVRKIIDEEIMKNLDSMIKGENVSLSEFKVDTEVEEKIGSKGYEYLEIKYEIEDNAGLKFEKGQLNMSTWKMDPSKLIAQDVKEPTRTKLKVTLSTVQGSVEIMTKDYDVVVLPKDYTGPTLSEKMLEKLEKNYTEDKFRCSVTGEKIDLNQIVNDIKIPTPKETGIEDYDNYRYFMTSSDEGLIKPFETKNAGKVVVYRPLPREEAKTATLTINMEDKETKTVVSKELKEIRVLPLTQEEIDKEIELMDKVKASYFDLIKGENISKDEITKDLKWFREVNLGKDGLTWNTHIKDDVNHGITPDALDGWYDTEQWRLFRTSNPEIITNENLLVTRPEKNTKVTIDSILTSVIYGKYAEKYPENEDFQKLYKQAVKAEVTVLGKEANNSHIDLDREIEFLKSVFEAYMEEDSNGNTGNAKLSLTGTGAAKLAGMDMEKVKKNIYIDKDNKTAYQLSQSIITLIGADLDPTNYKGRNLVDELSKAQNENGSFATEYKGSGDDTNSIESQVRSMIALDMAGAEYNVETAIEHLLDMYDKKDSKTYKEIETEGYILLALANHKDIKGAEGNIIATITRLSNSQAEDGSFSVKGIGKGATLGMARVVQGLVANGIDPLTDERFIKNENTIVDAILRNKVEKSELKKSGYSKKANDSFNYAAGSHIVFGALMDVKNQKSMFDLLSLDKEDDDKLKVELAMVKFDKNGKYEKLMEVREIEIDQDKYSGKVNLLDALAEANIDYSPKTGMITEIMGVGPAKGEGTNGSGWMVTVNGQFPKDKAGNWLNAGDTILKTGDKIVWSRVYDYENNILPTMEEIKDMKIEKSLVIDIVERIELGEQIEIVAKDEKGNIIDNNEILYLVDRPDILEVVDGKINPKTAGKTTITASLKADKNIKTSREIEIIEKASDKIDLDQVLKEIRNIYDEKAEFTFREAIGYRATSENLEKDLATIAKKIVLRDNDSTANLAGNIIAIVAGGENPYNYKGIDYVGLLKASQKEDGKFLVNGSENYATNQAFAVIALDMAGAKYGENTIEMLVDYQKKTLASKDDYKIDTVAMLMSALGNHMEDKAVKDLIKESVEFIEKDYKGKNIWSLSATSQGLVSAGEIDLSEAVARDLVKLYSEMESEKEKTAVREQVFIALADVKNQKSMFNEIRFNKNSISKIAIDYNSARKIYENDFIKLNVNAYDLDGNILTRPEIEWSVSDKNLAKIDENGKLETIKPGKVRVIAKVKGESLETSIDLTIKEREFEIKELVKPEIQDNKQVMTTIEVKNIQKEAKKLTLIIGLFNKDTNTLVNYSILEKELKAGDQDKLSGGFLVPEKGNFEIRTFLWDDIKTQNILKYKAS